MEPDNTCAVWDFERHLSFHNELNAHMNLAKLKLLTVRQSTFFATISEIKNVNLHLNLEQYEL